MMLWLFHSVWAACVFQLRPSTWLSLSSPAYFLVGDETTLWRSRLPLVACLRLGKVSLLVLFQNQGSGLIPEAAVTPAKKGPDGSRRGDESSPYRGTKAGQKDYYILRIEARRTRNATPLRLCPRRGFPFLFCFLCIRSHLFPPSTEITKQGGSNGLVDLALAVTNGQRGWTPFNYQYGFNIP